MLKKEEESAWFTENGLTDLQKRVEIPDVFNEQSRIKAEKGKAQAIIAYYKNAAIVG